MSTKEYAGQNLRDLSITTSSGKNVHSTQMMSGEAKDSLSGKNTQKEYVVEAPSKGKLGGLNTRS